MQCGNIKRHFRESNVYVSYAGQSIQMVSGGGGGGAPTHREPAVARGSCRTAQA